MKKRFGFVSNSSSSSFICCVCGGVESDMDASLCDVGMVQCELEHEFHEDCVKGKMKKALEAHLSKFDEDEDEDGENYLDSWELRESVPVEACPVCSMVELLTEDETAYLRKKLNMTRKEVIAEIKATFSDYPTFKESLK